MEPSGLSSFRENWATADKLLFCSVLLLFSWGVACIFSAASGSVGRGAEFALRQFGWGILSCVACLITVAAGYSKFMDMAYPVYALTLFLLFFMDVAAPTVKGAQRWLSLGVIRIQPSEFAKISLILLLSKFLSRYPPLSLKTFLAGWAVSLPAIFLLLGQPDLGSALVYVFIVLCAIFVGGAPVRYLFGMMVLGLSALPFAWFFLKDYQKMRILVFLDPTRDPLGAGYNVLHSRIAVGSGSFWGKGFLQGLQSKLRFLPEPHTDFIFSVYAEEFGFWGTALLLLIFGIIFMRIVAAGMKSRDVRAKILVSGVAAWIWFQVFVNIGMSMGLMPITGITLPFFSYGGSSLLAISIALGLVGSVYIGSAKRYR
jgi:rod shape determining protein RodA